MSRTLAGFLAAALIAAAGYSGPAQEPDPAKEKWPKIVFDPAKLVDDLAFAIQGEYLGQRTGAKEGSLAAQVLARGDGTFEVKLFAGGLPGAGWDGTPPAAGKGTLDGNCVEVKSVAKPGETLGVLERDADTKNRVFTLPGKEGARLSKIERKSPTLGAKPPKGAVVLFSGASDADKWDKDRIAKLTDGTFLQGGGVRTKQKFQSVQLHLEFRTAWRPGRERGRANVCLQDRHLLRVLDNFGLKGAGSGNSEEYELYFDLDAAAEKHVSIKKALDTLDILTGINDGKVPMDRKFRLTPKELKVLASDLDNMFVKNDRGDFVPFTSFVRIDKIDQPKVNMGFPPMTWQTYDIDFTAPEFNSAGEKTKPARATVKHNGVVIYDQLELKSSTVGRKSNKELSEPGPLCLPSGDEFVMFNNIWAVTK